jgi:uncharacterized damage-inducible protein DinB
MNAMTDADTTWTAPEIVRDPEPTAAGGGAERVLLEQWLDYHRQTLLAKCAGLTAEQLKIRAVPPSSVSLLGLLRHLADVERGWFRRRSGHQQLAPIYQTEADEDADFNDLDSVDAATVFAILAAEIELARAAAAGRPLEETFVHEREHTTLNLRWVYLHMIEEYARHNGHADLLREQIDGRTGD